MTAADETYNKKLWLLSFAGAVLGFLLLTLDLWTLQCLFKWDAWNQFWPWFHYLAEALRNGRFPLWEPHACCGFPYHADPTTGTFNPVYILVAYLFGGSYPVFQYFWLGHWFWGLAGFFLLAKKMGFGPGGAFVGSMIFGFNGFFIGHAEHTIWIMALSYFPWIILLLEESIEGNVFYAVPAGVLFGLTGPGMHIVPYMAIIIVAWCLLRHMSLKKPALSLALFFLVGAIVLAPSFLPFLAESEGYTDRIGALSVENACNTHRFLLSGLVSVIAPTLTVYYPGDLGSNIPNVPMMNAYFGIFGIVALCLVVSSRSLRRTWAWLLLFMLIAFIFSLGSTGGLRVLGYYVVPPLRYVRHSSLMRVFWLFGGALLAGLIADKMLSAESDERKELFRTAFTVDLVILYAALAALCWAWLVPRSCLVYEFRNIFPASNSFITALVLIGPQVAIIALFGAAFYLNGWNARQRVFTGLLLMLIVGDAALHVHMNKPTVCWNGQAAEVSRELERKGAERKGLPLSGEDKRVIGPIHTNLGIFDGRFYIRSFLPGTSDSYNFLVGGTWPPVQETGFGDTLVQGPRWWLSPKVAFAPVDNREAMALLKEKNSKSAVPIFVHSEAAVAVSPTARDFVQPGTYGSVKVLEYKPEEVVLTVDAPDQCWLFSTETYGPSWKAYVDGANAKIYKANFCFRALPIPQGTHSIRMEYAPTTYRPLVVLSWIATLAGLIVFGVLQARRDKSIFAP